MSKWLRNFSSEFPASKGLKGNTAVFITKRWLAVFWCCSDIVERSAKYWSEKRSLLSRVDWKLNFLKQFFSRSDISLHFLCVSSYNVAHISIKSIQYMRFFCIFKTRIYNYSSIWFMCNSALCCFKDKALYKYCLLSLLLMLLTFRSVYFCVFLLSSLLLFVPLDIGLEAFIII